MDRCLTWHFPVGGDKSVPTYYAETDYEPVAVRIYAETPPTAGDLEVDILADGVSIFNDHAVTHEATPTVMKHSDPANTYVILPKGDNLETDAEDFIGGYIAESSLVTCSLGQTGGASNITVHLELNKMDEPDETTE